MVELQVEIAETARFADDQVIEDIAGATVAGVDQAFLDEEAVSAVVVMQEGEVIERTAAITALEFPYVPGFLSFREGGPIAAAFATVSTEPDLVLFDGNGRLHYRQAGLATHLGVVFDLPSIGVAKSLLCGKPRTSIDALQTGTRVVIESGEDVEAAPRTVLGYALQTRQWAAADRYINPIYVSPGHRISPESAVEHVESLCAGYKLPEPIRLADKHAEAVKADQA
jgi:deoxyribonuclease V